MTVPRFFGRCVLAVLLLLFLAASPAPADWLDTFDGGFQQTWVSGHLTAGSPFPPQSSTFSFGVVGNTLVMTDPAALLGGGAASGFGMVVTEAFQDLHMSATLNPAAENTMNWDVGLAARVDLGNLTGYTLTVDFYQGRLNLTRIDPGAAAVHLGSVAIDGFAVRVPGNFNPRSVYIEFDLVGDELSGRAYDAPGGTLLTDAFLRTDATYGSGLSGVLTSVTVESQFQNPSYITPLRGTFDNVSASTHTVQAIPEPATLVLLGMGALTLTGWRWRRKRVRRTSPGSGRR